MFDTKSGTISGLRRRFISLFSLLIFFFWLSWLLVIFEHVLCIIVLYRNEVGVLIGDEEEAKRWNNRFSGENREIAEKQLDRYTNSSVAATSNTDKVSAIIGVTY